VESNTQTVAWHTAACRVPAGRLAKGAALGLRVSHRNQRCCRWPHFVVWAPRIVKAFVVVVASCDNVTAAVAPGWRTGLGRLFFEPVLHFARLLASRCRIGCVGRARSGVCKGSGTVSVGVCLAGSGRDKRTKSDTWSAEGSTQGNRARERVQCARARGRAHDSSWFFALCCRLPLGNRLRWWVCCGRTRAHARAVLLGRTGPHEAVAR